MATEQQTPRATYRQLGNSGLRVSVPIFGAMGLGDKRYQPWALEEEEALPLLKAAYDRGINTWDTSCSYSNGVSEILLGKAIKKYNLPRQKLVIMTKCYNSVRESNDPETLALKDLGQNSDYVDYIDVLQIHRFDPDVPIEEIMKALHDIVESGKVRYIGTSSMFVYQFVMLQSCAEKNSWTKFISMQNNYSLLYREEEREMNKYCNLTGVGIIPWGPLNTGRLARPAKDQGTVRAKSQKVEARDVTIIDRVEEIAEKKGWKTSQVALAWITKRVASPISGFSTVGRMDGALAAMQMKLTEQEEKYLEELYEPKQIKGHSRF